MVDLDQESDRPDGGRGASRRRAAVWLFVLLVAVVAGALASAAVAGSRGTNGNRRENLGVIAAGYGGMPMPVPMQTLGTATWQGMKITAVAATPLPFVVFSGTSERTVKPSKKASMHLMVMLSDQQGGVPIPYASVWATISKAGKVVYDERQWPMLSRYMGPHYGNDVTLPGAGSYQLTLLISPPQAARHMEYANVWLKPHRVTMTFAWKGKG